MTATRKVLKKNMVGMECHWEKNRIKADFHTDTIKIEFRNNNVNKVVELTFFYHTFFRCTCLTASILIIFHCAL